MIIYNYYYLIIKYVTRQLKTVLAHRRVISEKNAIYGTCLHNIGCSRFTLTTGVPLNVVTSNITSF